MYYDDEDGHYLWALIVFEALYKGSKQDSKVLLLS